LLRKKLSLTLILGEIFKMARKQGSTQKIEWCNRLRGDHSKSCCNCFFVEPNKSIIYRKKGDNFLYYQVGDGKKIHTLCKNCYKKLKERGDIPK